MAQDFPRRYISPLGAGRPPAGSSVTANALTVATPGSGRTERLPVPEASTLNTPAETGGLFPVTLGDGLVVHRAARVPLRRGARHGGARRIKDAMTIIAVLRAARRGGG